MGLLTVAKQKRFLLQTHAVDGDETLGVNEVDIDKENTLLALPSRRAEERP